MSDFNTDLINEFRANDGTVGGYFAGKTVLILTSTGAKSGQSRTLPLVYFKDGEQIYIIASKGGGPTNPDWYHNLIANPTATIEVPGETFSVTAAEVTGDDRNRLYAQAVEVIPGFGEYEKTTTRTIPVLLLNRAA